MLDCLGDVEFDFRMCTTIAHQPTRPALSAENHAAQLITEALETTKVHSVAGVLEPGRGLLAVRPFRAPHHTISDAGPIGGGAVPRPM